MTDDQFTPQEREALRLTSLGHESPALAGQLAARRRLALQGQPSSVRHGRWRLASAAAAFALVAALTLTLLWPVRTADEALTAALPEADEVADVDFYLWMNENNPEKHDAEGDRS